MQSAGKGGGKNPPVFAYVISGRSPTTNFNMSESLTQINPLDCLNLIVVLDLLGLIKI